MDKKLKKVIEAIHTLKGEALDEKCKKEVEGDTHNYILYQGKDMAYTDLLLEVEDILNT